MKSYTTLRNLYGTLTKDITTSALTFGDQLINDSIRTVANLRGGKWGWLQLDPPPTVATVANQQGYQIPQNVRKLMDLYITVGTNIYMPEAVFDPAKWKMILAYQFGVSDTPYFYYKQGDEVLIAPTPASNGNTITFRGRMKIVDLSIADYTTGTITSIASAGTAVVGSGTTWTADMVGRYIRITETSAAGGGDGQWYKIGTYTSATSIGLAKPYLGTTISAATAAYNIGQMSPIPEAYDISPVYRAAAQYWSYQGEIERANHYWRLYDGGVEAGLTQSYGGLIGQMLENEGESVEGAYIPPFASTYNIINPNYPQPDGSGF